MLGVTVRTQSSHSCFNYLSLLLRTRKITCSENFLNKIHSPYADSLFNMIFTWRYLITMFTVVITVTVNMSKYKHVRVKKMYRMALWVWLIKLNFTKLDTCESQQPQ